VITQRVSQITDMDIREECTRFWRKNGMNRSRAIPADKELARNTLIRKIRYEEESRSVTVDGLVLFRM